MCTRLVEKKVFGGSRSLAAAAVVATPHVSVSSVPGCVLDGVSLFIT